MLFDLFADPLDRSMSRRQPNASVLLAKSLQCADPINAF